MTRLESKIGLGTVAGIVTDLVLRSSRAREKMLWQIVESRKLPGAAKMLILLYNLPHYWVLLISGS